MDQGIFSITGNMQLITLLKFEIVITINGTQQWSKFPYIWLPNNTVKSQKHIIWTFSDKIIRKNKIK